MRHNRIRLPQRTYGPSPRLCPEPRFQKRPNRGPSPKRWPTLGNSNKLPQSSNSLGLRSPYSPRSIRNPPSKSVNPRTRTKFPRTRCPLTHRPRKRNGRFDLVIPTASTQTNQHSRPAHGHSMGKPWARPPPRKQSGTLKKVPDLRLYLERKTGFEPATLTLAKKGDAKCLYSP